MANAMLKHMRTHQTFYYMSETSKVCSKYTHIVFKTCTKHIKGMSNACLQHNKVLLTLCDPLMFRHRVTKAYLIISQIVTNRTSKLPFGLVGLYRSLINQNSNNYLPSGTSRMTWMAACKLAQNSVHVSSLHYYF